MSSQNKPTTDEDASTIASDASSKGSNHNLGAAVSGAMKKLSSPIAGVRKVVRKGEHSDHSGGRATPEHKHRATPEHKHKSFDPDNASNHQNPMKDVADFFGEGGKAMKRLVHRNKDSPSSRSDPQEDDNEEQDSDLPALPPDPTLEKMNIIINKRLKNVSIPNYYDASWSEKSDDASKEPLYRSFLEESGKENIIVGEWEDANEFVGDWDGEKYKQKRMVTFVFDKKIPMQSKPVVAQVKQTHYSRVEGNDKCVVAMTIEMQNVPFSDCFNVEIRWVATRSGKNDVVIQVGLFVNFVKTTMLAGKIRSGTTQQTTQQQMQLFDKVQQACGATVEEVSEEKEAPPPKAAMKVTSEEAGRILVLSGCLLLLSSQAECLFTPRSCGAAQMQTSWSAVTSILAGLMLLVPNVSELSEKQCLLVVIAHLAQGLCVCVASESVIVTSASTVLLMAAWAVLAWGVWRQGTHSKNS